MLEIAVATLLIVGTFAINLLAFNKRMERDYSAAVAKRVIRKALQSIAEEMKDRENGITDKQYPFIIE